MSTAPGQSAYDVIGDPGYEIAALPPP